jgi:DNA repair protein RecO
MGIVRTEGVVLRTYPFSETSKILHLYTLHYGPQSLMARGARRPKSKFGGMLETFTRLELVFYKKKTGSLHTLSECSSLESFPNMAKDLARFYAGSVCLDMVKRFVMPEEANEALYCLLTDSLGNIDSKDPDEAGIYLLSFVWRFLTLMGFRPDFKNCIACGRDIVKPAILAANEMLVGGYCAECSDSLQEPVCTVDGEAGGLLDMMAVGGEYRGEAIREDWLTGIWDFTTHYIKYHLHQEKDISSFNTFLAHVHSRGRSDLSGKDTSSG